MVVTQQLFIQLLIWYGVLFEQNLSDKPSTTEVETVNTSAKRYFGIINVL